MKIKQNVLVLLFLIPFAMMGQDDNDDSHVVTINFSEVAIVDIEDSAIKDITLDATGGVPAEAGDPYDFSVTNSTLWLNYTSILGNETSRLVTVRTTAGTIPAGLDLRVQAAADAGNGGGSVGANVATPIVLNGTDQNIITGIGSCYTSTGTNNGHNLTYSLAVNDWSLIDQSDSGAAITVLYTITDTP